MADKIVLGSDHAGLVLRSEAAKVARAAGFEVEDLGPYSGESVDYPDFARRVAEAVASGKARLGILVCGTGIGMAIAANKVPGVRAAQAHDVYSAERARKSNDAQVLALGARVIGPELARSIVRAWLAAEFAGGGSTRKVEKIARLEREGRSAS